MDKAYYLAHRDKINAQKRAYRLAHHDKAIAHGRERWKSLSKEEKRKIIEQHKTYRRANKEHVNAWVNAYNASRPEKKRSASLKSMRKRRNKIINRYGGKCKCCGTNRLEFLQISHKDQNGVPSQRKMGGNSKVMATIVKTWPKNIQILCANCHQALDLYGYCPHKEPHRTIPL